MVIEDIKRMIVQKSIEAIMNKRLYELKKKQIIVQVWEKLPACLSILGKPLCWLMDRDFATCK